MADLRADQDKVGRKEIPYRESNRGLPECNQSFGYNESFFQIPSQRHMITVFTCMSVTIDGVQVGNRIY
jgi:hypothetical protein